MTKAKQKAERVVKVSNRRPILSLLNAASAVNPQKEDKKMSTATEEKKAITEILKDEVFDLASFGGIRIGLPHTKSPDFAAMPEALGYFGNDEKKVLAALSAYKAQLEREAAMNTPLNEWFLLEESEDGTETLSEEHATIQPANDKLVNDTILNIAKQHFGFSKDAGKENKKAAKDKAKEYIKSSAELRAALVALSAATMILNPTGSK